MRFTHLYAILLALGLSRPVGATDQKEFARACDALITSGTPHVLKIGELYRGDWYESDDAVAILPISRRQLTALIQTGSVADDRGLMVNPVVQNPVIATWLHNHPEHRVDRIAADDLPVVSSIDAWARTIADILEDRTTRLNGKIAIDREQVLELVYGLRESTGPNVTFSPASDAIARLAAAAGLHLDKPKALPCAMSRDLARRLNLGKDANDLKRWSLLRAAAETFQVPWGFEKPGPDLERALESYFAKLPNFAGALLVLNEQVLPCIEWNEHTNPQLSRVNLSDVIRIETLGELEHGLLERLACAQKSVE